MPVPSPRRSDSTEAALDVLYQAQQALIAHDTKLASSLYKQALLPHSTSLDKSSSLSAIASSFQAAAALSLGNLYTSLPDSSSEAPSSHSQYRKGSLEGLSDHTQADGGGSSTSIKKKGGGSSIKTRDVRGMNQAGACYLVGLAWELEAVDLLAQNTKEARGRSKGKGREGHGDLAEGEAELMSRVESLHEAASSLTSLYRRNFITSSDHISPLPFPLPLENIPTMLSSFCGSDTPPVSVWQCGERLAEKALSLPAFLEEAVTSELEEGFACRSGGQGKSMGVSMMGTLIQLHYLLALTTHSPSSELSLSHFRAVTRLGQVLLSMPSSTPSSSPKASTTSSASSVIPKETLVLLDSASKRIGILESRNARSTLPRLDIISHLHSHQQSHPSMAAEVSVETPLVSPGGLNRTLVGHENGAGSTRRTLGVSEDRSGSATTSASISPNPSLYRGLRGEGGGNKGARFLPRQKSTGSTHLQPTTALYRSKGNPNDDLHRHSTYTSGSDSFLAAASASPFATLTTSMGGQSSQMPMRRSPSTFSNLTTRTRSSLVSLSPSILSLRLSRDRSGVAEGVIDETIAEGTVDAGSGKARGWFGGGSSAGKALGSLRKISLTKASHVGHGEPRNGAATVGGNVNKDDQPRTQLQSLFDPPSSVNESGATSSFPSTSTSHASTSNSAVSPSTRLQYPSSDSSPAHHTTRPRISSRLSSANSFQPPSSTAPPPTLTLPPSISPPPPIPTTKTMTQPSTTTSSTFSKHGDPSLDPHLRQLELDSKMTQGVRCGACGREAMNLPACPKCKIPFCSRECRVGKVGGGGDGKKHICKGTQG